MYVCVLRLGVHVWMIISPLIGLTFDIPKMFYK